MIRPEDRSSPPSRAGTVFLVGAGPGDPGLLTVRAARLLRTADVVVHDALVGERILEMVRPSAVRIDVGKRCGGRHTTQERINEILIESAATARKVVRLKGGDPFVFGRGGEEALALAAAGVRFEVVPGVTAAVGVSAYAGIPLTHRDFASSVTFVTGHEDRGRHDARVDWDALARLGGTLVIYMGMTGLDTIARRLIDGGRSPRTPAAVVQWGTYARQRTVEAPLEELAARARAEGIGAPALVVVGEVAALRGEIAWFDRLPLSGRRMLVARSRAQPSRLAAALRRLGAEVEEFPRLRPLPVVAETSADRPLLPVVGHDWLLFTSPTAVRFFWRRLAASGCDARALGGLRIASLGLATTRELRRRGLVPDVAARTYETAAVPGLLGASAPVEGARILFPRDDAPTSPIADALRGAGAVVDEVRLFRFVETDSTRSSAPEVVLLPSSTSARLAAARVPLDGSVRVVAIGPRTAETARALGLRIDAVADDSTIPGTVRALLRLFESDEASAHPRLPDDLGRAIAV